MFARRPILLFSAVVLIAIGVVTALLVTSDDDPKAKLRPLAPVVKQGSELQVDGRPFRFAGANMQWLGIDEMANDSDGNPTYPSKKKIDNGFDAAVRMNANVVRAHSLGISTGSKWSIEPALDEFNDKAFRPIDDAVRSANARDIRLIIPLTDMWSYKTGGKHNFTEWNGFASLPSDEPGKPFLDANTKSQREIEQNFYTDERVIASFERYVHHVLNHVDPETGVALKDNPTVLAWETGNELWDAPAPWTERIAKFIKEEVRATQLVADGSGSSGTSDSGARLVNSGGVLSNPSVDILSTHVYTNIGGDASTPREIEGSEFFTRAIEDVKSDAAIAAANGKAYFIGEFNWTGAADEATWRNAFDADALQSYLAAVEATPGISGNLYWALFPYDENGQPVKYNERFWMVDPPVAADPEMTRANQLLSQHALRVRGVD